MGRHPTTGTVAAHCLRGDPEMPKFKVAVTDDTGHNLLDEWIVAADAQQ